MPTTLKIVIPTAGWGTRMRPQTWSKAKPLVGVAGRTALDHLLDTFKTVPAGTQVEYVFIVGPFLGETQLPEFMQAHYPDFKVHYVLQAVMRGQSDALYLAREHLQGPMLMVFSDTLIQTNFGFLSEERADGVAWVKAVPDPRRFGVAELDAGGRITRLIEKPESPDNKLAVVGCYYFRQGEALVAAIEEQVRRDLSRKGEFFLTDAINVMLEHGAHMRTQEVALWLDTGTIQATLETNRYLLAHGCANRTAGEKHAGVEIVPPVFIHETAEVSQAVIGPYASIGAGCKVHAARLEDSILESEVQVEAAALKGCFIGRRARVQGRAADDPPLSLNIGDDSSVEL